MRIFGPPNVAKLAERGDVGGLARALRHSNESIRREAAKALGTATSRDAAFSVLTAQLVEPDEYCLAALAGLGASRAQRAVEILLVVEDTARIEEIRIEAVSAGGTPIPRQDSRWRAVHKAADKALAKLLKSLGDDAAATALLGCLEHDRDGVRSGALDALGEYSGRHAVPALSGALQHSDQWVCYGAAQGLKEIGTPEAIKALVSALSHESSLVRRIAFAAMGHGPAELTLPPLLASSSDADPDSRALAAEALGELGDPAVVPPLRKLLEDTDPLVRKNAKQALFELDRPAEITRILDALTSVTEDLDPLDGDDLVRVAEALRGSSDARTKQLVETLSEVVGTPPPSSPNTANKHLILHDVAWMRATFAPGLSPKTSTEARFSSGEWRRYAEYSARVALRSAAANALGVLGDPAAVPALVEALDDPYYFYDQPYTLSPFVTHPLRTAAFSALKAIGSPEAKLAVRRYKDRPARRARTASANLGRPLVRDEPARAEPRRQDRRTQASADVRYLVTMLGDPDDVVRSAAESALTSLANPKAIERLVDLLSHEQVEVVAAAARTLTRLGDARGSAWILIDAARRDERGLYDRAARNLERAGAEAVPLLGGAAYDESPTVRWSVAHVLGRSGAAAAVPLLIELLDDPDEGVREAALAGLQRIGGQDAQAAIAAHGRLGGAFT